ncbi:ABC transporter permease [Desulfovibrio inopinatus]|uniref:ABC transporter permease n=1 Tax=Desulfovibrio inopinatus TaxID=102109 RepID=UPI000403A3D3|nr:ABC transporter permease [Desulfovibrio inopinatus]
MKSDPRFSWLFLKVWRRNLLVYQRIWKVNFLVPMLEPLFYLLAFGLGFRGLIENVAFEGRSLSYTEFIAPALIATTMMWHSFFETTYGSFVRMYYQKTFDAMLATPLSLEEVITAEIVWGATKATVAASIMTVIITLMGYAHPLSLFVVAPVAFLAGLSFSTIGMFFTGITPSIDMFNLPVFLFITPMFLFSGTFFPVSGLPGWAQIVAQVMPLYHAARITRHICLGIWSISLWASAGYLAAFAGVFFLLALRSMRKRLVR